MTFDRDGKPHQPEAGPCTWCGKAGPFRARDHVFTRALGGTLELAVPSCPSCDEKIRNLEGRIARSSIFGLRRLTAGPPARKSKDPASGSFDPLYTFAPDPDGGFNDVRFRAGGLPPITLTSFQLDLQNQAAYRRYSIPEEYDRLSAALLRVDQATEGDPLEVNVRLLRDDDPLRDNPRFHPRVSLGLNGELVATARTPEEVELVLKCAIYAAQNPEKFPPKGERKAWEVPGGTPHAAMIVMNEYDALRLVSKTALGVASCVFGAPSLRGAEFEPIRDFVKDGKTTGWPPAAQIHQGKELEGFPDYHLAIVERADGKIRVVVVLSGYCYEVSLGPMAGENFIGGAVSRRDGSETFLIAPAEASGVLQAIARAKLLLGFPRKE